MQNKNSAKFAFFYMLSLVALIFTALSVGMIIFQIINKNIVDILNQYQGQYSSSALKFAISALVISAPIYFLTSKQIYKNLVSGELEKDSGVRKWLTYFILLISSVVMIGWLIATINSFLEGELTAKFILKALTALIISATVFSFYYFDIKREDVQKKNAVIQIYFYASLVVIIATFIGSLFTVESPTETRNIKFDQNIINNFYTIDSAINDFVISEGRLPNNIDELKEKSSYLREQDLVDPVSKRPYDYKLIGEKKYQLCANFKTSNIDKRDKNMRYYESRMSFNYHDSGYQCLDGTTKEINKPSRLPENAKPTTTEN